jgi:hypothetical protein
MPEVASAPNDIDGADEEPLLKRAVPFFRISKAFERLPEPVPLPRMNRGSVGIQFPGLADPVFVLAY